MPYNCSTLAQALTAAQNAEADWFLHNSQELNDVNDAYEEWKNKSWFYRLLHPGPKKAWLAMQRKADALSAASGSAYQKWQRCMLYGIGQDGPFSGSTNPGNSGSEYGSAGSWEQWGVPSDMASQFDGSSGSGSGSQMSDGSGRSGGSERSEGQGSDLIAGLSN